MTQGAFDPSGYDGAAFDVPIDGIRVSTVVKGVHLNGQSRVCGGVTIVTGQSNVYVEGELVAVDGDGNDHPPGGNLIAACNNFYINSKLVVNHSPDNATPDFFCDRGNVHCNPHTAEGSNTVYIGD